jgi:hypothetical protein
MHLTVSTGRWVAVIVAALMLLLVSTSVWAAPDQSHLRQTVPTRTPTKVVATPEPATATPEAVKPTSKPDKPQPTQAPTEAVAAPTQTTAAGDAAAQVTATAVVIAEAGYPKSGGDYTRILLSGVVLLGLASGIVVIWLRHRARAAR